MELDVVHAETLIRNWWVPVVRGLFAIAFGVLAFTLPAVSLAALVLMFGAYAFADGVLAIVQAFRRPDESSAWPLLVFQGICGVAAGLVAVMWPGSTALALLYLIGAWAIARGAFELAMAIKFRKQMTSEVWLVLSGILSILLGIVLWQFPRAGALALVLWIGAYSIAEGVLFLTVGFRLRWWAHHRDRMPTHRPELRHPPRHAHV